MYEYSLYGSNGEGAKWAIVANAHINAIYQRSHQRPFIERAKVLGPKVPIALVFGKG